MNWLTDPIATILAAIIVSMFGVAGWSVTAWQNRQNEIFKQRLEERLKRRMDMLDLIFDTLVDYANGRVGNDGVLRYNIDEKLNEKLDKSRKSVHLFGDDEEINVFDQFDKFLHKRSNSAKECSESVHTTIVFFRNKMRSDLNYDHK